MKVLFLYSKWTGDYKGITAYFAKRAGGTYPPLNIALLAAIAENNGHNVEIIDAEALKLSADILAEMAIEKKPDVVALTGMSPFFHLSTDLAQKIKKKAPEMKIVIGGQHITIMGAGAFDPAFDFGLVGDCEEQWPVLLLMLEGVVGTNSVPGLLYRDGDEIHANPRMPASRELDVYPWAARHLLPMHKYRLGTMRGRLPFTTIQTFRGCPWKCIFCASDQLETTKILKRSIGSVLDEIEHIISEYGIRHFAINDDVLTLDRKRSVELCNGIIERGLNVTFEGGTRANLVDDELIALMSQAGLIRLSFGLETVDSEMRETMKKEVPLEAYREANAICNKYGVEALNSVMIGLPGESRENIRKTLDFLRSAKDVKQANFAIATPYPGTEFHEMATHPEEGTGVELLIDDFSKYKRYGSAVTKVGSLGPDDLVALQNEGFVSVYSAYWRWLPVLRKSGVLGLLLTLVRYFKLVTYRLFNKNEESVRHPALD